MIKKSLNEKLLYEHENDMCKFMSSLDKYLYEMITNILISLKDNLHIYHINNYEKYNYTNNAIEGFVPLMLLLGGSAYKIYSIFFNKFFNKDIVSIEDNLLDSIDYDLSIIVNNTFNKDIAKQIIEKIIKENTYIINNITNIDNLEIISKEDIKADIFLYGKNIINKNYTKILITFSHSRNYIAIQFTIKYKNRLYQIIELLFWYNEIISNNIHKKEFEINKCILFQTDKFKILLPDLSTLIKTNIISMQSRIINNQYNKCTKDYYRLQFIKLISDISSENINDNIIKNIILKLKQIYKKENPNLFKLPYSICSLEKTDNEKKILYELYDKFLNLNLYEQINIMLKGNYIENEEIKEIKKIINHPN